MPGSLDFVLQHIIFTSEGEIDTQAKSEESHVRIMASEVERFERCCSGGEIERVKIERAIQEIDGFARRGVTDAGVNLEECQMNCAAVRARPQKAREGKCPSATPGPSTDT